MFCARNFDKNKESSVILLKLFLYLKYYEIREILLIMIIQQNRLTIENFSYGQKFLCFIVLLVNILIYSQSFNENNPAIFIAKDTQVYIDNHRDDHPIYISDTKNEVPTSKGQIRIIGNVKVYGIENFQNSEISQSKDSAISQNKLVLRRKNSQPSHMYSVKELSGKKESLSYYEVKSSDSSYTFFGLAGGNLEFAVLNTSSQTHKFFTQSDIQLFLCPFIGKGEQLFSAYDFSLVKRETPIHFSRPPPTFMIFFAA